MISIGLEGDADAAEKLFGSGTKFLTDLVIGDQITFNDNSNTTVTKIVESIKDDTELRLNSGLGSLEATRSTITRRRGKLQDAGNNIAISPLPYSVVKTLLTTDNASVSDTSFKIRRQFTATLSSSGTATLTAGTNEIFSSFVEADYAVSIMTTGSGGTGAAGDVISLSTGSDFTLGGSPTGKTLAINLGSGYNGHKIKILATVSASVVGAKTKTDTEGTQTVNTLALVKKDISLGKADIHTLTSVHMAADFSTAATTSDTDITTRFDLDNGQRDNFYDVGRLKLKAGKTVPTGRLLINFEYFEHGAGNFFSVDSYTGFDYGSIPAYTSDVSGATFNLRDVLDFRPRVSDAATIGSGDVDRAFDGTGGSIIETMKIGTDVTADLEYYLHKKARVYITSQGKFKVVEGPSSLNPVYGETLKNAMHLYDLNIPAYTFNTTDIGIKAIDNRRFTMRDIGGLAKRLENVEYYTQLSLLESAATGMQIQDADGFDRFKNGIIVDNFTGHGIGNPRDNDYSVAMDMAAGELRPACHSDNVNLIESNTLLGNSSVMNSAGFAINSAAADAIRTTNNYQLTGDLITLPYTTESYVTQGFASTTVNLQPYETISYVGRMTLSPNQDEWKDTETLPELTVSIPGTFDTMSAIAAENPAALGIGTVWNEWNNNWAGVDVAGSENQTVSTSSTTTGDWFWGGTTTTNTNTTNTIDVQQVNNRTRTGIRTALVPGGLQTQSLGNRVVQVAFAPFIRSRDITFTAQGLKPSTRFYPFFDGVDVSTFTKPSGGSYNGSLLSDATGKVTGTFSIIDPTTGFEVTNTTQLDTGSVKTKWRTGTRTFRLSTSSTDSRTENLTSSAEADYTARGLLETVQGTVTSSREGVIERTTLDQSSVVNGAIGTQIVSEESTTTTTTNPGIFAGFNFNFNFGWDDPVCQSFLIDQADGLYITDLDLFFQTKDSALPVTVQIVTMENGYPTSTQVPFARSTVAAADINTSTDASSATKFTFESPVFLNPRTEYSFRVFSSSKNYEMYTARMGQTTLDSARLISKQPYLGSMFKSQNSTTWTAEQNEDVKFTLNRAKFTQSSGTVTLVNDTLTTKVLPLNPITTIAGILNEALDTSETTITLEDTSNFPSTGTILIGSEQITYTGKSGNDLTGCTRGANSSTAATASDGAAVGHTTLRVNHRNHGMHSTDNNVIISGVPSGTYNGVASSNINGTYTAIGDIKLDSYTIVAQNSDFATAAGDVGGTVVQATRNIQYDVIHPVVGQINPPGTSITTNLRVTGGRTLEQSEAQFSLQATSKQKAVEPNGDYYLTTAAQVCSQINETNEMSGGKSLALTLTMTSPADHLSPVIDTKRLSATVISNRINNPISGTTPDFKEETTRSGGSASAKYITRPVVLENESTSLDVRLSAHVPSTAAVKMYYRLSNADDARNMDDLSWRAFNSDGTPDKAVDPSDDGTTFKELGFSFTGSEPFTAFALKIVLTGTSSCYPPRVKDMRGIALAV